MTSEELEQEIRSWLGTRWVHRQAVKGGGTDCVGFIIQVGKKAGWIPKDYEAPVYSSQWSLHRNKSLLEQEVMRFCDKLDYKLSDQNSRLLLKSGDIILYRYGRTPGHAGFYMSNGNVVHADIRKRKVTETNFNQLLPNLMSIWRPNV